MAGGLAGTPRGLLDVTPVREEETQDIAIEVLGFILYFSVVVFRGCEEIRENNSVFLFLPVRVLFHAALLSGTTRVFFWFPFIALRQRNALRSAPRTPLYRPNRVGSSRGLAIP
ncbi:hypothetical protein NDU88_006413 [Pleurodeles waltl]|uniref:Uncharacterized protein n=1 Tax=Pleurodeles waltl TaxID=8319 RepID=A0AAV7NV17_PLEWA|nr:hypothetical protein NDU88_006413 [Pleurodeles waltl]